MAAIYLKPEENTQVFVFIMQRIDKSKLRSSINQKKQITFVP